MAKSIQLQRLFDDSELSLIIEGLITALQSPITIEDSEGNLVAGQFTLLTSGPEYPIRADSEIIGWAKGSLQARILARLLTYLANQELLALFDNLTGIANRRYFEQTFNIQWRYSVRESLPISLLIADIDYFKSYNDYYGHLAGDNCLCQVSRSLAKVIKRPTDFLARYGGEEFVIILPNTDQYAAAKVADDLCIIVQQLEIPHYLSEVGPYLTISIGISTVTPRQENNSQSLVAAADVALYRAKAKGRNRYCFQIYEEQE